MKFRWLNCIILILSLNASLTANAQTPEQELIKLDFFSNGLGMHLSPGILNKLDWVRTLIGGTEADESVLEALARRWGIQSVNESLVGIKTVNYKGMKVGVLGCVACHSGKAAGQYIVGIGNKNIDPGQIGIDGIQIEKKWKSMTDVSLPLTGRPKNSEYRKVENTSIKLMEKLANPSLSASTQGLVPVSLVGSWFYEMAKSPLPTNGFKGAVKVPSWFGFEKKLEVGQFADAIGLGHPMGWIVGVEITSGQTPEAVREYYSKIEDAAKAISQLKPPPFPYFIGSVLAAKGKTLFEANCAKCHGTYEYEADGSPIYKAPKVIPLEYVGTDSDRLDYVTEDFLAKVKSSPLSDLIQPSPYAGKRMYVAPRLHGIWARFPYLHNASVPTLRDLLEAPENRPKVFSLEKAGEEERFDEDRVGLTRTKISKKQFNQKKRFIYDTSVFGQSNQGHEKGINLLPSEKDAIVEYLKTL